MSKQELHLTLEEARAGMTLARAVLDPRGQVLVASGAELSDATISALRRRDTTELWVLAPELPAADLMAQEAARRRHHKERLAQLFRHATDGAEDCHLRELIVRYRGAELP